MDILEEIASKARATVEIGGREWQVKKIKTSDLLKYGRPALLITQEVQDPVAAATDSKRNFDITKLRPSEIEKLGQLQEHLAAVACSAVTHVREGRGHPWHPVQIVMDEAAADPVNGSLYVFDLGDDAINQLANAAFSLVMSKGEAQALSHFRNEPGGAVDPGEDRENVSDPAA